MGCSAHVMLDNPPVMRVTVAVDCMGGDHGPSVTVPSALALLRHDDAAGVILVGLTPQIEKELDHERVSFGDRLIVDDVAILADLGSRDEIAGRGIAPLEDAGLDAALEIAVGARAVIDVVLGATGRDQPGRR